MVPARDPQLAKQRFEISGFQCEASSTHELFTSRRTGDPFLEAHHLIPMKLQAAFTVKLDTLENIYGLCPSCHRAIHHAEADTTAALITGLLSIRDDTLTKLGVSEGEVLRMYGC